MLIGIDHSNSIDNPRIKYHLYKIMSMRYQSIKKRIYIVSVSSKTNEHVRCAYNRRVLFCKRLSKFFRNSI